MEVNEPVNSKNKLVEKGGGVRGVGYRPKVHPGIV